MDPLEENYVIKLKNSNDLLSEQYQSKQLQQKNAFIICLG
jgi:hypothetical protein